MQVSRSVRDAWHLPWLHTHTIREMRSFFVMFVCVWRCTVGLRKGRENGAVFFLCAVCAALAREWTKGRRHFAIGDILCARAHRRMHFDLCSSQIYKFEQKAIICQLAYDDLCIRVHTKNTQTHSRHPPHEHNPERNRIRVPRRRCVCVCVFKSNRILT